MPGRERVKFFQRGNCVVGRAAKDNPHDLNLMPPSQTPAVVIAVRIRDNGDDVINPQNATASQRTEHQNTDANVPGVKAMHTELSQNNREQQCR